MVMTYIHLEGKGMVKNEILPDEKLCETISGVEACYTGREWLDDYGVEEYSKWVNFAVSLGYFLVLRVLAFFVLRHKRRYVTT
jgi:hypothetical protein